MVRELIGKYAIPVLIAYSVIITFALYQSHKSNELLMSAIDTNKETNELYTTQCNAAIANLTKQLETQKKAWENIKIDLDNANKRAEGMKKQMDERNKQDANKSKKITETEIVNTCEGAFDFLFDTAIGDTK